ncbi:hypothetical protein [uncultured Mediterranean phage uvMED]|nr:hypothetical protein [uncultured Mediterranean phage uvMED]
MSLGKNKSDSSQTFDPELKGLLTETFATGRALSQQPYQPYNQATIAPLSPVQLEAMNQTADTARAGVGQGEIRDAIATTRAETGFQPMMVNAGQVTAPGQVAGVNAGQVGTGFDFYPITNQQVQGRGVQEQQINPLSVLSAPSVGQTSAVQTGQIDVDPITAQQVQGQTVQAAQFDPNTMSQYTNPFEDQVVQQTISDLDRARQMTQNQNAAAAVRAGAFGGNRDALVRAETNRNFLSEVGRQTGALRQAGFDRGTALQQADLGRQQQAASQTAQLGQQAALANQRATLAGDTTSAQLGLQGQTETGRQALQSGLAAQAQNTQRALADQRAALTAGQQNLQADLVRQQANQRAALQADTASAANFMRADQLNAANNLAAQQATQRGDIQAAQLGQRGQLANQDAQMRAALANQNAALRAQQLGFDAQRINADAGLQAALANQRAGLTASGMRQGAAQQLAGLGGALRGSQFADAAALQGVGDLQQAAGQRLLDDRFRRFAEEREFPFRMFDVLRSGAGILPNPLTSSSRGRGTNIGLPGS